MGELPHWPQPWHWWILGALLLLLEVTVPGASFVWLALSAFGLGLLSFIFPFSLTEQLLLFAGLSVAAVWLGRLWIASHPQTPTQEVNSGAERLLGRAVMVTVALQHGQGRVRVGDSEWRATGPDLPVGAAARVTAVDGITLRVERDHEDAPPPEQRLRP